MGRSRTLVPAMLLITSATVPFKRRWPCCVGVEICTFWFNLWFGL